MKKITVCFAMILISFSFMYGCNKVADTEKALALDANVKETSLMGFETQNEINYVIPYPSFGKRLLNTDKNYVSAGNASMFAQVEGVNCYLAFMPKYFYNGHNNDFSKAQSFLFDIYNASDRDTQVTLSYCYKTGTQILHYIIGKQYLRKGAMNYVCFDVDLDQAINNNIGSTGEIRLTFETIEDTQTPLMLYVDNFRVREYDTVEYNNQTAPAVSGDIVCSFEGEYFKNTMNCHYYEYIHYTQFPVLDINTNPDYITEGSYSLKVTRFAQYYLNDCYKGYTHFGIPSECLSQIDFTKYDASTTDICFDVYNSYDYLIDITFNVSSKTSATKFVILEPNCWTKIKFEMSAIEWVSKADIDFIFSEYYDSSNAVMYIDNVRFEQEAAE